MPGAGPKHRAAVEQLDNARNRAKDTNGALTAARAQLDALRAQLAPGEQERKQEAQDKLPAFEKSLAAEGDKLSAMKAQLADLTNGRDEAIRRAVENAPNRVPMHDGLLAQISELEKLSASDGKIYALILLIDIVSFGLELAAVLAKVTSSVPSHYARSLARDAYVAAVGTVDEIVRTTARVAESVQEGIQTAPGAAPANDNHPFATDMSPFTGPEGPPPFRCSGRS